MNLLSALLFCLSLLGAGYWMVMGVPVPDMNSFEEDHELSGGFFEGDIELDMDRNGLINLGKRWPNNIVPFKIDIVFDEEHTRHIHRGMKMIEEVSCIRFTPAEENDTSYVFFIGEPTGCHTKVGHRPNGHTLNLQVDPLDKGCFKLGTIVHEMLHMLGFYHQQSAADRDEFVEIKFENIQEGKESNFNKYDTNIVSDFGIEYDYGSILHYSSTAFSKNKEKTIIPLKSEDVVIGQRARLSPSDIAKLNLMYKCRIEI